MEALLEQHDRYMRNLKTQFERPMIEEIDWDEQLICIKGARGVGKTTLIQQHIKKIQSKHNTLYVCLDDVALPFNRIIEGADWFVKRGGYALFLDEIHKYPNWSSELKNIYDRYPELKVVFTGSSTLQLSSGEADLSRRAFDYTLNGLSFREFVQIETKETYEKYDLDDILQNHRAIANEICGRIKPLEYFDKYLKYGYLPFYLKSKKSYSSKLLNTIKQVIETDLGLLTHSTVQDVNNLKKLLYFLSRTVPYKPNINSIAASMEISRNKVYHFLDYLAQAEIINLLKVQGNGFKTLTKPEKIYLQHPNLIYAFDTNNSIGNIRETFFLNALRHKHNAAYSPKSDFLIDNKYTFEIGGKNKGREQITGIENSYLALDDIETGYERKVSLWVFWFLG